MFYHSWDPLDHACWYTNDSYHQRIAWQIGTQLFWNGLTVAGEVVAACIVTVYMLKARVRALSTIDARSILRRPFSIVISTFSRPQRCPISPRAIRYSKLNKRNALLLVGAHLPDSLHLCLPTRTRMSSSALVCLQTKCHEARNIYSIP